MDYLSRLSERDAAWLASFTSVYLGGQEGTKTERKEANRRRYRASDGDALAHTTAPADGLPEPEAYDDLTPEKILLLQEELSKK